MALSDQLGTSTDTKNTKATKAEANYRHGSYGNSGRRDRCGSCKFFEHDETHAESGTCTEVAGSIKFDDVCDYYQHRVHGGSVEGDGADGGGDPGEVAAAPE